ncbi:hypothetical protein C8R42DRAFT_757307 [Lentinula raphanica]|nr:hypothetical protein C8R42DRAFT_757307 [Lentinula raphanica]
MSISPPTSITLMYSIFGIKIKWSMTPSMILPAMAFVPPPLTMAVEYQFDFHLSHNPNHPAFVCPEADNSTLRTYTYADVVPAIHRCALFFQSSVPFGKDQETPPVIAFVTTSDWVKKPNVILDALTYSIALLGVLRAGMTAFPISPRFSATVIAHLISAVKPSHVVVDSEGAAIMNEIMKKLDLENKNNLQILGMPTYERIFVEEPYKSCAMHNRPMNRTALIIHSSGSTSLCPKTIAWTSDFYAVNAQTIGICFLNWMVHTGFVMALLNPKDNLSRVPADPDLVFKSYIQTSPSIIYATPQLLEIWSQDSEKCKFLSSSSAVATAGRALNRDCARKLLDSGVPLGIGYGSTESGSISIYGSLGKKHWDYFHPLQAEVNFVPQDNGFFSMLVSASPTRQLPVSNTRNNGILAYDPGDLFQEHPTDKGFFRIVGRSGDQIMLSTGEIVEPTVIESTICQLPEVENAMLFGTGRPSVGLLVQITSSVEITESETKEMLLNQLCPCILMLIAWIIENHSHQLAKTNHPGN